MPKPYRYVGSSELIRSDLEMPERFCIRHSQDIFDWLKQTDRVFDRDGEVIATFIIDLDGQLWIADRHSEHLYCARNQNVLSAGEITFSFDKGKVEVSEITNQSTGSCPEIESGQVVAFALDRANLIHPNFFTTEFIFRLCDRCKTTNVIKDNWFQCSVCSKKLSDKWNYDITDIE